MFNNKRLIQLEKLYKDIETRVDYQRDEIIKLESNLKSVSCEICKCVVFIENAHKGKPEVRTRTKCVDMGGRALEDYIYYPYYCETHKNKKNKSVDKTG